MWWIRFGSEEARTRWHLPLRLGASGLERIRGLESSLPRNWQVAILGASGLLVGLHALPTTVSAVTVIPKDEDPKYFWIGSEAVSETLP